MTPQPIIGAGRSNASPPPVHLTNRVRLKHEFIDCSKGLDAKFPSPEKCPICHSAAAFQPLATYVLENLVFHVLFVCPVRSCRQSFIGNYQHTPQGIVHSFKPKSPDISLAVPETVQNLSPNGIGILQEALAAESYGLPNAAGPAFRKAFEFILKDFLIALSPSDRATIEAEKKLGVLIKDRIDNPRIKLIADRCAWLGNDQVHYTVLHTGHDITTLKDLLRVLMDLIDVHQLTEHYAATIQKK